MYVEGSGEGFVCNIQSYKGGTCMKECFEMEPLNIYGLERYSLYILYCSSNLTTGNLTIFFCCSQIILTSKFLKQSLPYIFS